MWRSGGAGDVGGLRDAAGEDAAEPEIRQGGDADTAGDGAGVA